MPRKKTPRDPIVAGKVPIVPPPPSVVIPPPKLVRAKGRPRKGQPPGQIVLSRKLKDCDEFYVIESPIWFMRQVLRDIALTGFSMRELCRRAGVSHSTLYGAKKSPTADISLRVALHLADALGFYIALVDKENPGVLKRITGAEAAGK